MANKIFTFGLLILSALCIFHGNNFKKFFHKEQEHLLIFENNYFSETISFPQSGAPIEVGGGNVGMQNSTSSMPGSGYPGDYMSAHSNNSAPTSPPINSGSVDVQNSTLGATNCDCEQLSNVQEQVPSDQAGAPEAPSSRK